MYFLLLLQAGIAWLAGVHPEMWVSLNETREENRRRRALLSNWTLILNTAIDNLHKCLWFGIVEDMDRSMELFRYQSGIDVHLKKYNVNKKGYPKPTNEEVEKLKMLMPMDMYLYEYAKQLHKYRYQMFKQQQQQQQQQQQHQPQQQQQQLDISVRLPTVLEGCKSDGSSLKCNQNETYFKELEETYTRVFSQV